MSRWLREGRIELAITYDVGLGPRLGSELLAEIAPYALLHPAHPLAAAPAVTLEALSRHPFVLVDLPLSREFLMMPFWQRDLDPTIVLRTHSVEMVRGMVANGLGVSVLFTRPRHDLAQDGLPLVCRPILDEMPRQRLVAAYPEGGPLSHAAQNALGSIRAQVAGAVTGAG